MKKEESLNTDVLIDLINQLTDIGGWLAREQSSIDASYEKYNSFYIPASNALKEFGIRIDYNGYAYIMEAVKIIIERDTLDVRLSSDIYPVIAKKYHVRKNDCIEHNIRNAINVAYRDNLRRPGCNGMKIFTRKPTNKQFLMYLSDRVRTSMFEYKMRNRNAG